MEVGDKILELMKYKIGMWVKCDPKFTGSVWYNEGIFEIVKFSKNDRGEMLLVLDKKPQKDFSTTIHPCYVVRDKECIRRERKLKLDKINESR